MGPWSSATRRGGRHDSRVGRRAPTLERLTVKEPQRGAGRAERPKHARPRSPRVVVRREVLGRGHVPGEAMHALASGRCTDASRSFFAARPNLATMASKSALTKTRGEPTRGDCAARPLSSTTTMCVMSRSTEYLGVFPCVGVCGYPVRTECGNACGSQDLQTHLFLGVYCPRVPTQVFLSLY